MSLDCNCMYASVYSCEMKINVLPFSGCGYEDSTGDKKVDVALWHEKKIAVYLNANWVNSKRERNLKFQ